MRLGGEPYKDIEGSKMSFLQGSPPSLGKEPDGATTQSSQLPEKSHWRAYQLRLVGQHGPSTSVLIDVARYPTVEEARGAITRLTGISAALLAPRGHGIVVVREPLIELPTALADRVAAVFGDPRTRMVVSIEGRGAVQ
jgi:hypothetical protein